MTFWQNCFNYRFLMLIITRNHLFTFSVQSATHEELQQSVSKPTLANFSFGAHQCDQIGQFFALWQQLFYANCLQSKANFCKGVKIIHFSSEIIFGQLLQTFGDTCLVTLAPIPHYLNVRSVPLAVLPGRPHRREDPVGVVKLAALQRQEHRGEGLEPDHVVEDEGRGGVMSAVVERRNLKDV